MNKSIVRSGVAALALGAVLASATALPARANTTTDILYGAAAAAAAVTLYNVEHKHQLATTVQGYLPDGSTVYADGRVVSPNGYSWYPGNNGETVACSNQYCSIDGGNGYGYNGYSRETNTNNNNYAYRNSRHYNYNGNRDNDRDGQGRHRGHHGEN
jgi:hypothetical protein